jgi:hypothetical protein
LIRLWLNSIRTTKVFFHRVRGDHNSHSVAVSDSARHASCVSVSSFQINAEGKILSEWSRSIAGSTAIDYQTYLKSREMAILASSMLFSVLQSDLFEIVWSNSVEKLHYFVRTTMTKKCLFECHGNAFWKCSCSETKASKKLTRN